MRTVSIPADIKEFHPKAFGLVVDGDAMAPAVYDGDVVIVDPARVIPRNGQELAVIDVGGSLVLCRPLIVMGQAILLTDKERHPNLTFPLDRINGVGAVVYVSHADEELVEAI